MYGLVSMEWSQYSSLGLMLLNSSTRETGTLLYYRTYNGFSVAFSLALVSFVSCAYDAIYIWLQCWNAAERTDVILFWRGWVPSLVAFIARCVTVCCGIPGQCQIRIGRLWQYISYTTSSGNNKQKQTLSVSVKDKPSLISSVLELPLVPSSNVAPVLGL